MPTLAGGFEVPPAMEHVALSDAAQGLAAAPTCVAFKVPMELLPAHGVQKTPHRSDSAFRGVDVGSASSLESLGSGFVTTC